MSVITFVISGVSVEAAAAEFKAMFAEFDRSVEVKIETPEALPADSRKAIDPIALASLILSIPSFVLAVVDLADRVDKRRRAQKLIAGANRLQSERNVVIHLLVGDTAMPVKDISPDVLLEAARK